MRPNLRVKPPGPPTRLPTKNVPMSHCTVFSGTFDPDQPAERGPGRASNRAVSWGEPGRFGPRSEGSRGAEQDRQPAFYLPPLFGQTDPILGGGREGVWRTFLKVWRGKKSAKKSAKKVLLFCPGKPLDWGSGQHFPGVPIRRFGGPGGSCPNRSNRPQPALPGEGGRAGFPLPGEGVRGGNLRFPG